MMTLNKVVLGAALASLLLGGCMSRYEVSVRNEADQPITATLSKGRPLGMGATLDSERIGPGDRAVLGPVGARLLFKGVYLRVDFMGNVDAPEVIRIRRGYSGANVSRADEGSEGTIDLDVVRP